MNSLINEKGISPLAINSSRPVRSANDFLVFGALALADEESQEVVDCMA